MAHFSLRKLSEILVILVISFLGLWLLLPALSPFLLAISLSFMAEPLVVALGKHFHLPRGIASFLGVTVALLLSALLLLALCGFLIRELGALAGVLPDLENATMSGLDSLEVWLLNLAKQAPEGINPILVHSVEGIFSNGSTLLNQATSGLLSLATSVLKGIPDSALGLGTCILASFMFSTRLPKIRAWISAHIPAIWKEQYIPRMKNLKGTLWEWIKAQGKLVGITFLLLCIGFLLLRISHPILWAGAVCLVDILPILGTGTVLLPWSLVCFLQGDGVRAIGLMAIYTIITLIRSILEPRLVGKHLGLDPLVTLLSIYAGYRFWGLPGMLLAPLFAVVATQILPLSGKSR